MLPQLVIFLCDKIGQGCRQSTAHRDKDGAVTAGLFFGTFMSCDDSTDKSIKRMAFTRSLHQLAIDAFPAKSARRRVVSDPRSLLKQFKRTTMSDKKNLSASAKQPIPVLKSGSSWTRGATPSEIDLELSSPRSADQVLRFDHLLDEELPDLPLSPPDPIAHTIAYKNYMLLRYERQKRGLNQSGDVVISPRASRRWENLAEQLKDSAKDDFDPNLDQIFNIGDRVMADYQRTGIRYPAIVRRAFVKGAVCSYLVEFEEYDHQETCKQHELMVMDEDECAQCGGFFPRRADACITCGSYRPRQESRISDIMDDLSEEFAQLVEDGGEEF